jgi:hypothetical protein
MPKPEIFVKHAIRTVGINDETNGYWIHTIFYASCRVLQYLMPSVFVRMALRMYTKLFPNYSDDPLGTIVTIPSK